MVFNDRIGAWLFSGNGASPGLGRGYLRSLLGGREESGPVEVFRGTVSWWNYRIGTMDFAVAGLPPTYRDSRPRTSDTHADSRSGQPRETISTTSQVSFGKPIVTQITHGEPATAVVQRRLVGVVRAVSTVMLAVVFFIGLVIEQVQAHTHNPITPHEWAGFGASLIVIYLTCVLAIFVMRLVRLEIEAKIE